MSFLPPFRLTAFIMKIFCQVQNFAGVNIDEKLICESVGWLYQNQRGDGAFPEVGRPYFSRRVTVRIVTYFTNSDVNLSKFWP